LSVLRIEGKIKNPVTLIMHPDQTEQKEDYITNASQDVGEGKRANPVRPYRHFPVPSMFLTYQYPNIVLF